jgi:hypothetical protein
VSGIFSLSDITDIHTVCALALPPIAPTPMSLRLLNYNTILQLGGFPLLDMIIRPEKETDMIIRPEKETENWDFEIPV